MPDVESLGTESTTNVARSLALLLKIGDKTEGVRYGIEITEDGMDRVIRIPLVRISDTSHSIWKVVSDIKSADKGYSSLQDAEFFISKNNNESNITKVLIFRDDSLNDEKSLQYVKELIENKNYVVFSLSYLANLLKNEIAIDIENLLGVTNKIYF